MPSLAFIALIAAIGLLAMIPTRRLFIAGWRPRALTAYFLLLIALGFLVAELRGPARFLVPVLVVVYVAPFVTARDGISRLRGRFGGGTPPPVANGRAGRPDVDRPPPKNVTPKESRPPDDGR